ncbi:MAG TPA: hypothetical protein VGC34_03785 [Steroidobacteraceae bacterium]
MTPPPPTNTSAVPTMRVAVELTYVRSCAECRAVAERTAVAAIHDASVTAFRAVPGARHAHAAEAQLPQPNVTVSMEGQPALFEPIPQSDTNGFDPKGRNDE